MGSNPCSDEEVRRRRLCSDRIPETGDEVEDLTVVSDNTLFEVVQRLHIGDQDGHVERARTVSLQEALGQQRRMSTKPLFPSRSYANLDQRRSIAVHETPAESTGSPSKPSKIARLMSRFVRSPSTSNLPSSPSTFRLRKLARYPMDTLPPSQSVPSFFGHTRESSSGDESLIIKMPSVPRSKTDSNASLSSTSTSILATPKSSAIQNFSSHEELSDDTLDFLIQTTPPHAMYQKHHSRQMSLPMMTNFPNSLPAPPMKRRHVPSTVIVTEDDADGGKSRAIPSRKIEPKAWSQISISVAENLRSRKEARRKSSMTPIVPKRVVERSSWSSSTVTPATSERL